MLGESRKMFKKRELVLGGLTVAAGLLNVYLWKNFLLAGKFADASFYSLPVISLFAFAVLFSLSAAFIQEKWLRIVTAMASLAGGYIFIPFQPLIVSAGAATALAGWYASSQISREESTSNSFSAHKIFRSGLPMFFTAMALVLAVFYFTTISGQTSAVLLPKAIFDAAIPLLTQPLQGILPGFRSDASVDELLLAFASRQLGEELDISRLPKAQKDELIRQGRQALSQQFGIKLAGEEKAGDILYDLTNAQVAKFLGPYQKYLPMLAALGFFIAIKAFSLPIYWITLILVWAVVKLLVSLKILHEKTETVQVTRIKL